MSVIAPPNCYVSWVWEIQKHNSIQVWEVFFCSVSETVKSKYKWITDSVDKCNILTFDRAVNQETNASGRGCRRCHLDLWTGWIRCRCDAHKKQVEVKQLYNPVPQTVSVSWSQLEFELQFEAVRTSSRQRACGSQWPPVEQPSRIRKKCCYSQRNLGSICCSLLRLQLTSHTQPFHNPFATLSNKEWEVYFFKAVCSFVIFVDYVSAYVCIRIVVSRLYNISFFLLVGNGYS